jgi:hypothetical protein
MKHTVFFLALTALIFTGCSKDDGASSGPALVNDAEANSNFNSSNFGIYKGVIADPGGVIIIDMKNDGEIMAVARIDGHEYDFTTTQDATDGEAISAMTFTSGEMTFDFYVNADGSNAYIADAVFPGHNSTTIDLVKEYSDAQVTCFDGAYAGSGSGEIEFILQNSVVHGLTKASGTPDVFPLDGVLDGNAVTGIFDNGEFTGTRNGNKITGTIDDNENGGGSYTATRHL